MGRGTARSPASQRVAGPRCGLRAAKTCTLARPAIGTREVLLGIVDATFDLASLCAAQRQVMRRDVFVRIVGDRGIIVPAS